MAVSVEFALELPWETNARNWNPQIPTEGVHEKISWVKGIWSLLCKWTAWCDPAEWYESCKHFLQVFCRIGACKWNSSFSDNQVMKLCVKIGQFYWWRKNNMTCFQEIKPNLPHVYGMGCSVCIKQTFCNAYGAVIPVRLQYFSHLLRWFITCLYEYGDANTDINSGCVTPVVMHKEILDVWQQCTRFTQWVWYLSSFYYIFLHNLLVVRRWKVFPAFLFTASQNW